MTFEHQTRDHLLADVEFATSRLDTFEDGLAKIPADAMIATVDIRHAIERAADALLHPAKR